MEVLILEEDRPRFNPCLSGRVLCLSPLLDTAFGRGLGAVLFCKAGCRENNIGKLCGLG